MPATASRHRTPGLRAIQLASAAVACIVLAGCSVRGPTAERAPPWRGEPPPTVEAVDPLALTPDMRRWLDRYVEPWAGDDTRRYLLALGLGPAGAHGFRYDATRTLTAAGTFRARVGNCISFAHLLVALGRAAGLDVHYERIETEPDWAEREDAYLVGNHVVAVFRTARGTYLADPAGIEVTLATPRQRLGDAEARALHHNNLAAEALLERQDLPLAYAHALTALRIAPGLAEPWVNLGVVLTRNEQFDDAERAYLAALDADPAALSAMSNLYGLYRSQGRDADAGRMQARVERHRRNNPYYLLRLAEDAEREGRLAEARSLVEAAVERKDTDPRVHFALARARWLSGDTSGAREALDDAWALAPPGFEAPWEPPGAELP